MRTYLHAWCVACFGQYGGSPDRPEEEYFMRRYPDLMYCPIDMDSEEDFFNFAETAGTHFWDVEYARLSLYVERSRDDSGRVFLLRLMSHGCGPEREVRAAMALDRAGIRFVLSEARDILDDYLGEDTLVAEPRGGSRNSIDLAEIMDVYGPETYGRLVAAIDWEPVVKENEPETSLN